MSDSDLNTVYVGTYTRRESFVDGKGEGIYIYDFDSHTGALSPKDTVTGIGTTNPSYLTITPDKNFLVAVNEITGDKGPYGTASIFAIDADSYGLTFLNQQSTHGLAPCYVSIEPEGRWALVANYESGSICVLPIQADGLLGEAADVIQFRGSGPNIVRQEGPHAHMILPGPGARFIFAVDLGSDRIWVYRLDLKRGKLIAADRPHFSLPPGTGPRHLAFHPRSAFVYVLSELQSTVTACHYDDQQGALQALQTISMLPDSYSGDNLGAEIQVAPSGRYAYASNRGHDSIVTYAVNQETGELSIVGHVSTQGNGPRYFALDNTGEWLLVANQDSDTVVTFRIDPATGEPRLTNQIVYVPTPVCLQQL